MRGSHAVTYGTRYPAPDHAEQDPATWDAALGPAIAGALAAAGVTAGDIAAIAVSGQLDGCVAVDANGAAVHPALIWQDRRATAEASCFAAPQCSRGRGVADASHMAPKIRWLRKTGAARFHQPDVSGRAACGEP